MAGSHHLPPQGRNGKRWKPFKAVAGNAPKPTSSPAIKKPQNGSSPWHKSQAWEVPYRWDVPKWERTRVRVLPGWSDLLTEDVEAAPQGQQEKVITLAETAPQPLALPKTPPQEAVLQEIAPLTDVSVRQFKSEIVPAKKSWAAVAGTNVKPVKVEVPPAPEPDPWAKALGDDFGFTGTYYGNSCNAIFASPWLLRTGHSWRKQQAEQKNLFCTLPTELLLRCTPPEAETRLALASTCQQMLYAVCSLHTTWNVEKGELCGHERGLLKPMPTVVITSDYCDNEEVFQRSQRARLMTLALDNHCQTICSLELYRVPFLEMTFLHNLFPRMTSLKRLGIYSCQLLSFGHTIPLVESFAKGFGKRATEIELDFFPRKRWNNIFVRPQANIGCVLPHLFRIVKVVQEHKVNLFRTDGAFLRFLNQPSLQLKGYGTRTNTNRVVFDKIVRYATTKEWDDNLANWLKEREWRDFSKVTARDANFRKFWQCYACNTRLHGVYFAKAQHKNEDRLCLGCIADEYTVEEETQAARLRELYRASRHWLKGTAALDGAYGWEEILQRAEGIAGEHFRHLSRPEDAPDTMLDKEDNVCVRTTHPDVFPLPVAFEEFLKTDNKHWQDLYAKRLRRGGRGKAWK